MEAVKRLREFISLLAHELRTPLTSTRESLSLLLDEIPGRINQEQREFLSLAKEDIERLSRLVKDVSDLTRMEEGDLTCEPEGLDIGKVIKDCILSMKPLGAKKGLALEGRVPEDLPKAYADKDRMKQVLINLIDNAIKFSPPAGKISLEVVNSEDGLRISVADQGKGIGEEERKKIFDKFYQVKGKGPEGGIGLGLSIVKGLIEVQGGEVWVESQPGKGTKFIFTLPRFIHTSFKSDESGLPRRL